MAWTIAIYRRYIDLLLLPSSHTLPVPGGVLPVLLIGKDLMRSSEEASVYSRLVPPNVPSFAELCRTTDDRLFNQILSNKAHVFSNLLPPTSEASQNNNLRQRRHHLELPNKPYHLIDNNFIQLMLFLD